MARSNYANGFLNGVTVRGKPLTEVYPGEVFWVNNSSVPAKGGIGGSNNNKGSYLQPFSTINYAMTQCTDNRGDIVAVMPGHAETISASATFTFSTPGVAVVGLGAGSLRPTITFDTIIDSTMNVDSANCSLKNFILTANFADITTALNVIAKDFHAEDCYFKATATNMNFLRIATATSTANTADGLSFKGCKWIEPDTATVSMVQLGADTDQVSIEDCYVNLGVNTGDLAALVVCVTGKDATNIMMKNNDVLRRNDAATQGLLMHADTTTANTGIAAGNRVLHADAAGELLITADMRIGLFDNKACGTGISDAQGYPLPAIDS